MAFTDLEKKMIECQVLWKALKKGSVLFLIYIQAIQGMHNE